MRGSGCRSTCRASSGTSAGGPDVPNTGRRQAVADVGFVGLGVMGGGIAKRLLDSGHTVYGYNRTRSRAEWLLENGIELVETPRDAAEPAAVVLSMVANTAALEA